MADNVAAGAPAGPAPAQPATGPSLHDYPVDVDAGDLFRHAAPAVEAKWVAMAQGLVAQGRDANLPVQELVARQIQDLGLSFRLTGDRDERPWPLSPMPLIVGADEWAEVERGLVQRATLLEKVAADIYGPQRLVADGHLPAAVVSGSRFFARQMQGLHPPGGNFLHVYAADLARGPRGQWRVLADRLRLANGIGYALENRLALSRASGQLLSGIHTRRLASFFAELRAGIARDCPRENPRIALLTPGRFNQSYPEQAHLARYLGFPLVEGRDLMVADGRLYVRTISGPKRIDAAWRWIDSNALDPLHFDAGSAIGVPDMFGAWASGGLTLANWPGVEVLEAPAMQAFLPRLCRKILGEEPALPNIATWWCGQSREAALVRDRLPELMIASAFGHDVEVLGQARAVAGAELSAPQRAALAEAMTRRPMDYCGQEIVHLSTTPTLLDECFAPRAFTVRAFVARGADGEWTVMPGGFARLSASGELVSTLMGEGDFSADLCVVDAAPTARFERTTLAVPPLIRRRTGILASQAADNLYWFGRYCERAEMTARVVRAVLGGSIEADSTSANPEVRALLIDLLGAWGALAGDVAALGPLPVVHAVLVDPDRPGALPTLFAHIRNAGLTLRDRFAPDFWRIAGRPCPVPESMRRSALVRAAREVVERFCTLAGLASEDMVRGPAWRFLDIGKRIERAITLCRMARHFGDPALGPESLGTLLDLCDSQITYRSRYLAGPQRGPVLDLLLLDAENPRSLVFQAQALSAHFASLPPLGEDGLPEVHQRLVGAILAPMLTEPVEAWDEELLAATEARLLDLSNAVSQRFFLQFEKTDSPDAALLA